MTTQQYYQWYWNTYLPYYYQQQQRTVQCPSGYTLQNGQCVQSYYGYQYPQYNYAQQYGYNYQQGCQAGVVGCYQQGAYAASPQQCVGQGGLWDSFSNSCTPAGGGATQAAVGSGYPNVLGMEKWTAVRALNNAGYNVWLLSENGIPQGTPTDYNARRVQITVNNGAVTYVSLG